MKQDSILKLDQVRRMDIILITDKMLILLFTWCSMFNPTLYYLCNLVTAVNHNACSSYSYTNLFEMTGV